MVVVNFIQFSMHSAVGSSVGDSEAMVVKNNNIWCLILREDANKNGEKKEEKKMKFN